MELNIFFPKENPKSIEKTAVSDSQKISVLLRENNFLTEVNKSFIEENHYLNLAIQKSESEKCEALSTAQQLIEKNKYLETLNHGLEAKIRANVDEYKNTNLELIRLNKSYSEFRRRHDEDQQTIQQLNQQIKHLQSTVESLVQLLKSDMGSQDLDIKADTESAKTIRNWILKNIA